MSYSKLQDTPSPLKVYVPLLLRTPWFSVSYWVQSYRGKVIVTLLLHNMCEIVMEMWQTSPVAYEITILHSFLGAWVCLWWWRLKFPVTCFPILYFHQSHRHDTALFNEILEKLWRCFRNVYIFPAMSDIQDITSLSFFYEYVDM